jgi:hypothetical protein
MKHHEDDDGPPYDDARLRKFFCSDGAELGFGAQVIAPRGSGGATQDPDAKLWNRGVFKLDGTGKAPSQAAQHRATYALVQRLPAETIDVLYRAYGPESACPSLALLDDAPARAKLGRWRFMLEKTSAARRAYEKANREMIERRLEKQAENEASRRDAIEAAKATLVGVQREATEDAAQVADFVENVCQREAVDLPWHSTAEEAARQKAYDVAMLGGARVTEGEQAMTFVHWLKHRATKDELRVARREAAKLVLAAWNAWADVRGRRAPRPRHERLDRDAE